MVEVYVGTSGWVYDWNPEGRFDWYARHSGLNAVELNSSFYRFPFPSQVKSWASKGAHLRWAIKVHHSITHLRKLSDKALPTWEKFRKLFDPLEPYIDFYLFQMPPSFSATKENRDRVRRFALATKLGSKFAIEFRHRSWFNDETVRLCRDLGITVVSIDAPIGTWIASSNSIVYLRLHGRTEWYAHDYTEDELRDLAFKMRELSPEKVYVFFNNDHWMLDNARKMMTILRQVFRQE